jgi:hypothetical protein
MGLSLDDCDRISENFRANQEDFLITNDENIIIDYLSELAPDLDVSDVEFIRRDNAMRAIYLATGGNEDPCIGFDTEKGRYEITTPSQLEAGIALSHGFEPPTSSVEPEL